MAAPVTIPAGVLPPLHTLAGRTRATMPARPWRDEPHIAANLPRCGVSGNGSWSGSDRLLRLLRVVAIIVLLALLAFGITSGTTDGTVLGTLIGALLVLLGYQVTKLPGLK